MENKAKVLIPSFEFDRKTKALNKYLLPFVSFISMFTVSVFVGGFIYAFLSSFLELPETHLSFYIFIPFAAFILSTGVLVRFFLALLSAYRIEDKKIIRGRISKLVSSADSDLGVLGSAVTMANGARIVPILKMIKQNMLPGFADGYFDTEVYAKKEFTNPILINETKHTLVYLCDGNKKLRIPKIYDGICDTYGEEGHSFGGRVAIISLIIFALTLAFAAGDLAISKHKTDAVYAPSISASESEVQLNLEDYGFTLDRSSSTTSVFTKKVGDRTSEVKYTFDKYGNIKRVSVQLYFGAESENVEAELRAVLATMNTEFDEGGVNEFISAVQSNLAGEYQYYRLISDKYILTVGTSGEYVDVH